MATNPHWSAAGRNRALDTMNTELSTSATMKFYSGTQPATADTALSGNTLLGTCALTTPNPFGASASGTITAAAISSDTSIDATATCTFCSLVKSDGTTRVLDLSVGTATADVIVNSTAFQSGAQLDVTSLTFSLPA